MLADKYWITVSLAGFSKSHHAIILYSILTTIIRYPDWFIEKGSRALSKEIKLHAILIHGMGRTPMAMSILAARLQAANIRPHLFGYSVTFERWDECIQRYEKFIIRHTKNNNYIIVGHSLGTVLTRATLPRLIHKPKACFFLAPPTQVCKAARNFAHHRLVNLLMGEIGQVLADKQFMESLPLRSALILFGKERYLPWWRVHAGARRTAANRESSTDEAGGSEST